MNKFSLRFSSRNSLHVFAVHCFTRNNLKLRRCWGSGSNPNVYELSMVQFINRTATLQVVLNYKIKEVVILYSNNRQRKNFLELQQVLTSIHGKETSSLRKENL